MHPRDGILDGPGAADGETMDAETVIADEADALVELTDQLKALASPVRLQLLAQLRVTRRPGELEAQALGSYGDLPSGRTLSRSTLQEHLAKLEAEDLVRRLDDGDVVLDRQRLVQAVRRLQRLAELEPVVQTDVEETMPLDERREGTMPDGPKLVLVNGPEVGAVHPLEGPGEWTIGREDGLAVCLAYDPHVSQRQAIVSQRDDGLFEVEALPGTTNPTMLDFQELAPGIAEPLLPGAVVSVGASRLVFRAV